MNDPRNDSFLTIKGLALRLRLSERQIRRLLAAGALPPPVRIGRSVRFVPDVVDDWIAAGCPRNWPKQPDLAHPLR
ncbi:MAG: helix-turn-helix transcriptional regulator [Phycisphaerae bacterium]